MGLYDGLTTNELNFLRELIENRVVSRVYSEGNYIDNTIPKWLAIYSEHLNKLNKNIYLNSCKYYYRQDVLDTFFPTATHQTQNIAMPFSYAGYDNRYEIMFVDTSTGAKIYEYASKLCEANKGYKDLKGLTIALTQNKQHRVKVVKSNDNLVFILTNNINQSLVIQALAILPALFEIQELLENKNVLDCCKDVLEDKPIKPYFENTLKNMKKIQEQKQLKELEDILNKRHMQTIEQVKNEIDATKSRIKQYLKYLDEYYNKLEEKQALRLGLESKKLVSTNQVKDLLNYINKNRLIVEHNIKDNGILQLIIQAPISIYDPEPLARQVENRLNAERGSKLDYILKAFKRIFIDEELTMICETAVKINIAEAKIDASYYTNNKPYEDYNKLMQPHLTFYNCWGDNLNIIKQALRENDIIGAINNILIATQNINFTDSAVFSRFLETIRDYNIIYEKKSCLSKADGNLWSIKDIVEQIQREENAEKQEKEQEEIGHPELEE